MSRLSLVIPCFNEEQTLESNLRRVVSALEHSGMEFEVIVSNDGSEDRSLTIMRQMAEGDPRIRILDNQVHRGKGSALTNGFLASRYEVLAFIDADLEIDICHLFRLVEHVQNAADIAIGSKTLAGSGKQHRPLRRRVATWGFNFLVHWLLGSRLSDHQTGVKAFKRDALLPILPEVRSGGWTWDTEVLIHAQCRGLMIAQVPVETRHQRASNVSIIRHALTVCCEIFQLYHRGLRLKQKEVAPTPGAPAVSCHETTER